MIYEGGEDVNLVEKLISNIPQIQKICDYLLKECEHDKNLAEKIMLENKTLNNMYRYIMNTVKNKYKNQIVSNGLFVTDQEVYGLAVHYFLEDDETLRKEHPNIITKEEVKKNMEPVNIVKKQPKVENQKPTEGQLSLFDFGDEF